MVKSRFLMVYPMIPLCFSVLCTYQFPTGRSLCLFEGCSHKTPQIRLGHQGAKACDLPILQSRSFVKPSFFILKSPNSWCWKMLKYAKVSMIFNPIFLSPFPLEIPLNHHSLIWLVVSTPLKYIRQFGLVFPTYGKTKHVPKPPTSWWFTLW